MLTRAALANYSHGSAKLHLKLDQDLKRSHKPPTGVWSLMGQEFNVFQHSWYVLPDEVPWPTETFLLIPWDKEILLEILLFGNE